MIWRDLQSLFQLAVGINLAFYSFKELREPSRTGTRSQIDILRSLLREAADDLTTAENDAADMGDNATVEEVKGVSLDCSMLLLKLGDIDRDFKYMLSGRWFTTRENTTSILAIGMAFISLVCLYICSLKADSHLTELSKTLLVALSFIVYVPALLFMALNTYLIMKINNKIAPPLRSLLVDYFNKVEANTSQLANYRLRNQIERLKSANRAT